MRVSYVAEVTFDFPEARYLRAVVKPKCDADLPFSIDNARWELYYRDDDGEEILEDSGECEVSAHELSAFIQPQRQEHTDSSTSMRSRVKRGLTM